MSSSGFSARAQSAADRNANAGMVSSGSFGGGKQGNQGSKK